ncbi:hypothetical protein L198_06920 [Cryptococcus wingfieldii CBS 7118]|uniref:Uncharacterized protein n=1 Tax=Cryptococcus wingfieldii CBS 7118 TaxID=1295528 RepID=A0A1E3IH02_9TREE|nr:hypothetical protein L198_06920 [Cryptococcus wingfieldii CBS 7118]ODN87695.1 hypothetical protein L198_06920 [Cryptococcus wingfieldii CBS 7118]
MLFQDHTLLLDVASGAIQDRTPGGSYDRVLYLIIAIKALQVCLGPLYFYLDRIWLGGSLRLSEKKRLEKLVEKKEYNLDHEGWRISKLTTRVVGGELVGLVITAWVVYIVYSLGT